MFNSDIPLYSVMLFLAFVANIIIVLTTYEKEKFTRDEIVGAIIYENIGMICGAKLLTYLQDISMYNEFDFWSLGLSSYGAVLGGIVFLLLFSIQFKKKTKDLLLTFAPSLPLMYGIGKIGCFFVGCCYGIEYDGLGKIVYKYSDIAPNNVGLFPIQLLEAIIFIIIFFYILKKVIEKKYSLYIMGISCIICALAKFLLDFFRMNYSFISTNQIVSLFFIMVGVIVILKKFVVSRKINSN